MNDMTQAIVPKSDQINADDFLAGPRTVKITGVDIKASTEQPVAISFDGDNGKPWKPCKSMSRVLVMAWGADAKQYVGRSVTLYRDPGVKWGGLEVGGIRISHMSNIEGQMTMILTATKGSRKPFIVRQLIIADEAIDTLLHEYERCATRTDFEAFEAARKKLWSLLSTDEKKALKAASDAASARIQDAPPVI